MSRLSIVKGVTYVPIPDADSTISFEELKGWIRRGSVLRHILRYSDVRLRTHRIETLPKPLLTALILRALSRGSCRIADEQGHEVSVGVRTLARLGRNFISDWSQKAKALKTAESDVAEAMRLRDDCDHVNMAGTPVYLRTDLAFGIPSGGSIGHIAGVLNHLDSLAGSPLFLTTDRIPTVRADIETHVLPPEAGFGDFVEVGGFVFNRSFESRARQILDGRSLGFVYQRYSANNYAGLRLARMYRVPFVLEYNGSEIWINRHWGKALKYEALSERVEIANLHGADVIVVVSDPMRKELIDRGVDPVKILVNANGVDPNRYTPTVDGSVVRGRYGIEHNLVIGFIGTFGLWHGAEVLAQAFGLLLRCYPEYEAAHLLMIGDGPTLPGSRQRLADAGVLGRATFTGRTAQEDGPAHLAACDILVSPHVPNADGTPFFGSPTKLFEYMAIGKAIVASDLDQIGEVLEHDRTGWLVRPGDAEALAEGLRTLIEDPERRARLGRAAREEVVAKYTWHEHTRKIIEKLRSRCA